MSKIIISLIFLFLTLSCKTFDGQINIKKGKTLPITVERDAFLDDEFEEYPEDTLLLILSAGAYSTQLSFSSDKDLSLVIKTNNEEYTLNAYLNTAFPDIKTEGKRHFLFTAQELEQKWHLKGNIETTITSGSVVTAIESCSVRVRTWQCYDSNLDKRPKRSDYKKGQPSSYNRDQHPKCGWAYHYKQGTKDAEYYIQTTNYKIFANFIAESKNTKAEDVLASYNAKKNKNKKIYQYRSCCYDYADRCLINRRY